MSTDGSTDEGVAAGATWPGSFRRDRDGLALPGVALAAFGFAATGDAFGIAVGALLLLAWALARPVTLATLGAFLFVTVQPGGAVGLLAGAGLAAILIGPALRSPEPATELLTASAVAIVLGGVVVWTATAVSLAGAAAALVVGAALVGYGLHRFEVVTVEQAPTDEGVTDDG